MDIGRIKKLVKQGKYHYSDHAIEMIFERVISEASVVRAILEGEVLETYIEDVRGKSYLVLGKGPLHVVVGYNRFSKKAIVITTYIPELPGWITPRNRG